MCAVGRLARFSCSRPARGERKLQRARDLGGELTLDGEEVVQLPVVALRPELLVGARIDQLGGNADATAGETHATLQQHTDAQFPGNLARALFCIAVVHYGSARHYP